MKFITIAKISGSHGLDGTFKVLLKTEYPEIFDYLDFLMLSDGKEIAASLAIEDVREQAKCLLIKCEGIDDRTASDKFKGCEIVVPEDVLPQADDDEVYWSSIVGSKVYDEADELVGTLEDYMETGGGDVFIIRDGKKEFLISNNDEHVLDIDAENKKITVNRQGLVSEDL